MIIKSMSRKEASFGQLVDYMEDIKKSDKKYSVYSNVFSRKSNNIKQEFEENADNLHKRKNGVFMYHEVISITKAENINIKEQKEKLCQIVQWYIHDRARNNLVYAVLHDDKADNLHYHLMISSNQAGESKRFRLGKFDFDKIKKDLEKRVLQDLPELNQGLVINKQAGAKLSKKGGELKRRSGKTSQRDQVIKRFKKALEARTKQEFFDFLQNENLEIYQRGKSTGIIDKINNRKHRIKTLGLEQEFSLVNEILESTNVNTAKGKSMTEKEESWKWSVNEENMADIPKKDTLTDKLYDAVKTAGDGTIEAIDLVLNGTENSKDKSQVDKEVDRRLAEIKSKRDSKKESSNKNTLKR